MVTWESAGTAAWGFLLGVLVANELWRRWAKRLRATDRQMTALHNAEVARLRQKLTFAERKALHAEQEALKRASDGETN